MASGSAHRLAIGTVQFGLDYGISNDRGKVPPQTVRQILEKGRAAGISVLDTAAAYGQSEAVVAAALEPQSGFRIVTKTLSASDDVQKVLARAHESAGRFGRASYALLVHSAADLQGAGGDALWRGLQGLRDEGLFGKIGISAYGSDDPVALARRFSPDVMQLPVSVLDQRLVGSGALRELKRLGVEIHVRSVFVQGAIFLDPEALPPFLAPARAKLIGFHRRLAEHALTPLQAAIAFPLSLAEVDKVVVGVTSPTELGEIVAAANTTREVPWPAFALDDDILLDPRKWQPR